ncbi:MAG: hypothetical protein ACTHLZ_13150, partial [Tepidisphaeraceae bacterium]
MDATYHLRLLTPHHGDRATIDFRGSGLQDLTDESWGLAQVRVTPIRATALPAPDEAKIAAAFATAIDHESAEQPEAVNTLVSGMDRTTEWIRSHVTPEGVDARAVADAVHGLSADDEHMNEREAAKQFFKMIGPAAETYLRDARAHTGGEARDLI